MRGIVKLAILVIVLASVMLGSKAFIAGGNKAL